MTQKKKETIGSVLMYIALALTAIYLIFAIISLFGIVGMKNDFAKLGAMLALRYLLPFTICMVINFFLTGVGAISKNWIVTLISCILYFVAIIVNGARCFIVYFYILIFQSWLWKRECWRRWESKLTWSTNSGIERVKKDNK